MLTAFSLNFASSTAKPNVAASLWWAQIPQFSKRFVHAGKYQSALCDKGSNLTDAHSLDIDKLPPSNWATFLYKSSVMLLSLIISGFFLDSIALSQIRGQLRLRLCDTAKYRNSPKGLFMQAGINRRLVTKMWVGHMVIVQMLTSYTLHVEQHSFAKVRSCCCLWFSLLSFRWGLTETRPSTFAKMLTPSFSV